MSQWDLFFVYGTELPEGVGFPMYGAVHFLWLGICTLFTVLLILLYIRLGKTDKSGAANRQRKMDRAIGIFLMACIVVREIYMAFVGHLNVYELPLHLCALAGIFCFIHCFKNWDGVGQILYSLCLPGTIVALAFPDWTYYPAIHFITIEGFLFHFGVALYVICQLISKRIVPDIRKLWKVFVFLAVAVPLLYLFNKKFGTNYFFVNVPSKGSPLEWIEAFMGNPGYLIGYGILAVVITSLLDLIYMGINKLRRKEKGLL